MPCFLAAETDACEVREAEHLTSLLYLFSPSTKGIFGMVNEITDELLLGDLLKHSSFTALVEFFP